jgi:hypothetical protein
MLFTIRARLYASLALSSQCVADSTYFICASGASIVESPLETPEVACCDSMSLSSSMSVGNSASISSSWNNCGLPRTTLK